MERWWWWVLGTAAAAVCNRWVRPRPWGDGPGRAPRLAWLDPLVGAVAACAWERRGGVVGALDGLVVLALYLVVLIDLDHQLIPDQLVAVLAGLGLGAAVVPGGVGPGLALAGAAAGLVAFTGVALLRPGALGGGDVKLMGAAGLYLGYPGVLVAMTAGFMLAAVVAAVLLLTGVRRRQDLIPFAPFLATGILLARLATPWLLARLAGV